MESIEKPPMVWMLLEEAIARSSSLPQLLGDRDCYPYDIAQKTESTKSVDLQKTARSLHDLQDMPERYHSLSSFDLYTP